MVFGAPRVFWVITITSVVGILVAGVLVTGSIVFDPGASALVPTPTTTPVLTPPN